MEGDSQVPTVMAAPQSLSPASEERFLWGLGGWRIGETVKLLHDTSVTFKFGVEDE